MKFSQLSQQMQDLTRRVVNDADVKDGLANVLATINPARGGYRPEEVVAFVVEAFGNGFTAGWDNASDSLSHRTESALHRIAASYKMG